MTQHIFRSCALAALFTTTLIGGISGCHRNADPKSDQPQQMVVGPENIYIASNGIVTSGPAISGTLTPELSATVRSQVTAAVVATNAEQGQTVSKGQVLGRLDASAFQEAFVSAKSGVASAQTAFELATRDYERQKTLFAAGAISQRDLEAAQRTFSGAQSQLEAARAQLANASKNLENTRIVAPFSGVVSQKSVNPGDVVQPGGALFTVVDPRSMRLDASVSSNQLSSIKLGTDVTFSVNGYPGREFHGRVTRVSPTVDPSTRQVMITASIPNTSNALVAGLYAEGRLSSSSQHGIVVPASAIDTRLQRPAIVRLRNGKVERIDVQLGMRDANTETVQITSGVAPGDTLLVAAAQAITPGTPVKVQADPTDANPPTNSATTSSLPSSSSAGGGASR